MLGPLLPAPGTATHRSARVRSSRAVAIVTALAVAMLGTVVMAPAAQAAGAPDFDLTVRAPSETLQGAEFTVDLVAQSLLAAGGQDGYNLTFRLELPAEATVTSVPAPSLDVVAGSVRTVVWANASDLLAGATSTLSVTVAPNRLPLGDVSFTGAAYLSDDPRAIPDYDADGVFSGVDASASDTGADTSTLVPFTIAKDTQTAEKELLRGVHDQRAAVELTLSNNHIGPSTGLTVTDYIPAELEFLGCGDPTADRDNSAAQEAGTTKDLNEGVFDLGAIACPVPSFVDTQTLDPDGAGGLPSGVYTVVTWSTADLAAAGALALGEVATFQYVVGVPQYRNTDSFSAGAATTGVQGSNLDNNTGTSTAEGLVGTTEQTATNLVVLSGTYDDPYSAAGSSHTAPGTDTVFLEDISIHKSEVSNTAGAGTIAQDGVTVWDLVVETSEYATSASGITVVDHVPDGLVVTAAPLSTSIVTAGPGTTVTWGPAVLGTLVANSSTTLSMTTRADTVYQDGAVAGQPVRANDAWTNTVDLSATSVVDIAPAIGDRPLLDASEATQSAGPIALKKYVTAATAGGSCSTAASLAGWQDVVWSTDFGPGDLVCWRVDVTTPAHLDTTNLALTDFLPAGYTYVSALDGADSAIAFPVPTVAGESITWDLAGLGDLDRSETATVLVLSRITDAKAHSSTDIVANLAKLAYTNTPGAIFQLRDQADAGWKEAELSLAKSADRSVVDGSSLVTYTLTVTNGGDQDALGVEVRDLLPAQFSCAMVVNPTPAPASCTDETRDRLDWTLATVAAGSSQEITYQVDVPNAVVPGSTLTNNAGIRSYQALTNSSGDPRFTYYPENNIDPTVTPNTDGAGGTVSLRVPGATLEKGFTTDVVEPGNSAGQATPGETVHYTVRVTLPAYTTLTNGQVNDPISSWLTLDEGSVFVAHNDSADAASFTLSTTATSWRLTFPASYTVGAADEVIDLTFDAVVNDASGPVVPNVVTNTATLTATSLSVFATTQTRIVEPNLGLAKTGTDAGGNGVADPGELLDFTVTVRNTGDTATPTWTSTAYDTVLVDDVPSTMTPTNDGATPLAPGAMVDPDGGLWNGDTITWTVGSLAPSTSTDRTYQVLVDNPIPTPASFTNAVSATTTSMAGTVPGERGYTDASGASAVRYRATDDFTFRAPDPSITKTVTAGPRTIGEILTYTVRATIPANVTTFDATVLDTLPAGMAYVDTLTGSCVSPGGCSLPVGAAVHSGQNLAWYIGDIPVPDGSDRIIEITYRARVDVADTVNAVDGATLTNSASIASNGSDKITSDPVAPPALAGFDRSSSATAEVDVVEPNVLLTKTVASGTDQVQTRRVLPGEIVTYTITLENTGSSTAFDVAVADTTDPRLTDVTLVVGASTPGVVMTDGDPGGDGGLAFTVPAIAASAIPADRTATVVYTATVPDPLAANPAGDEVTNTAGSTYSSLPGVVPDERTYTSNVSTVGLEGDVASIGDTVWFDANGNGVQGADALGVSGVTVTVTYLGADGVLDALPGGDDEVHVTTTNAAGTYLVDNLPQGDYLVAISGVQPGTVNTYDEDSGTTAPDGVTTLTLADGDAHLTADFGLRGSGTVGDTVWLDSDGDGTQAGDGSEPGLAGIGVIVVWHGPDGDVTFTTATGTDGSWSVPGVPAGALTVTLAPATFPAGLLPVSERDVTVDGSVDLVFDGTTDPDYDFGLRGPGSLGDLVWLDVDSDGTRASDGTEPGIAGASIEVVWTAPNGGTDAVLTVTTGPDGEYSLGNLPLGDYTVSVTSLPTALAPTYDLDGGVASPNGTTDVTLTTARPAEPNADFGYVAATGVGDTVFLDLDGSGSEDLGEPGIPGVEVTVTSGGPDGLLSTTGDNLVVVTTTDGDGHYQVLGLPEGETLVEITGGLPGGLTQTYDADGLATAGTSRTDLELDVFDDLQDFGYVGANSIGDTVWVEIDADGVQDAGEPGLPDVLVGVLWLGQDGVEGGADDILFLTVTDADGHYLVGGLPNGSYEVAILDGVPAGYTESYDETDELDGFSVVDGLGADGPEEYRTADFGYTGTGAVGGTIWLDREVDGELDTPTEAGLPGIVVDVTWAGPDGVLGTDDDVVVTTVTGEGGAWSVEHMPPGPFTAVVDTTTIPEGTEVVWDRAHGTSGPDGVYVGGLAPGEVLTDIDTAVRGTASIGDLVWVDSDRDGLRSPTDPVAPNVRVVVTWLGADGLRGGSDDVSVETRTDASGIYLVDGLPAGRYVVVFDEATFPKGTTAFADLDGGDPLVTSVSLTTGQVRIDVDLVLRPSSLATTGATVGGLALLVMLLLGGGVLLRRRASVLAARVE